MVIRWRAHEVLGAFIASVRDIQRAVAPVMAYVTILTAVVLSTLYVVMIKRAAQITKLSSMSLLFWNSSLTIPVLTSFVSLSGRPFLEATVTNVTLLLTKRGAKL